MSRLPAGTVTFLFTDIEGSTRLLQTLGARYAGLLADHHRLVRAACRARGGEERETHGDGLFFSFPSARAALLAAVAAQRAVTGHAWPDGVAVRVRMGIHTGEPLRSETGYVGIDIHRAARICAAGWGGQILLSQTTRDLIQDGPLDGIAVRDLGEHRLKDLARPDHLFQVVARDLPLEFPSLRSLDTLPNNLPIQLTNFVGREREIAEVRRLLAAARLLTLVGAGGCGKTRLALQVAADVVDAFSDGVWLAELGPLAAPDLVPQAVALVLSIREEPRRPMADTLIDHLRARKLLLLLDTCEHLLSACANLTEHLLRRCPDLVIMATSREGLGIEGERQFPVPPLRVPDPRATPSVESLMEFESVRLLVERATARLPGFAVTPQNAAAVAQVCHRLDGLPLAIELAAARVAALPVEQIAHRLDDRFRLLGSGTRAALPHHQTLHALIDWSHDLLSERERITFRRLAVFVGGWTLEAAEVVCAGDGIDSGEVVDLVTQLVGRSLVTADLGSGEARYRLLETIREYAREKLQAAGEGDRVRSRHLACFLQLAEAAEPLLRTVEQLTWLRRLELEHDNIRAALDWARSGGDVESGLRLAAAAFRFWYIRGHVNEGRNWLEGFLAQASPAPARLRAKALRAAGMMARDQGDQAQAQARFDESMAIFRDLGDPQGQVDVLLGWAWIPVRGGDLAAARAITDEALTIAKAGGYQWGVAEALHILGHVEVTRGEYAQAHAHFEESVTRFRALGNRWNLAHPLTDLGREALRRGDYAAARALFEESMGVFREFGGKQSVASTLDDLGLVALAEGDHATARRLYEESLGLCRELGARGGIATALTGLADAAQRQGDLERALACADEALALAREFGGKSRAAEALRILGLIAVRRDEHVRAVPHFIESLRTYQELGDKFQLVRTLEGLALATTRGQPARAARMLAAAQAMRETLGMPLHRADRPEYDRAVAEARAALDTQTFDAMWTGGRATSLEEAVREALAGGAVL